jgi:uncharacterized membrane protein (DUF373 family)
MAKAEEKLTRQWVARGFTLVEDIVYVGLGLLLAGSSLILLVGGVITFAQNLIAGTLAGNIVALLDRILLILLVVELMYTVQVSFREHSLVPEPFLIVGLVAAVRRILVITAEFAELMDKDPAAFTNAMIELALLSVMVLVLVASLLLLKRRPVHAERS